ncbi:MAG: hypothetical protein WDZ73_00035 [Candidatus Paceibacterota bacterium]
MIDIVTIFLAQIWGPILIAMSAGVFVNRNYYLKIYRNLDKETLAVLCFGLVALVLGIVHIGSHNVWSSGPQIIISFLGWALLIKGLILTIKPQLAERAGGWVISSNLISIMGAVSLVLGLYLTWVGYFM